MSSATTISLLDRLDESKHRFNRRGREVIERTLARLARLKLTAAAELIRFHETLLFLRAYPPSVSILTQAEAQLASFAQRVELLGDAGADLSPLEHPEVSGIAGTEVTDTFSYYIVRWLVEQHRSQVAFNWGWFEDENRLAATWPRFLPLLEEDALVEANVPYRQWLREAKGRRRSEVQWLIERFESLPITESEQAELYDSLKLYIRWRPKNRATRTGMRLPAQTIFYHDQPLFTRKDVSLADELLRQPVPLKTLSRPAGEKILNFTRATSTVRYRELYGFTHGDPARVLKASIGRGVDLFIMGLPPEKRLPLRAYHAAMIFKNGVPVGYFEGLSLFERMESGFNFYYTFREGETAWIYARTLSVFKQLLAVTAFSIDPYQIGYQNEEGIESGAFWFYRKSGFRPTQSELLKLTIAEEKRMATRKGYRTTPRTLRRLAAGYMIFELSQTHRGEWDTFQTRKIGWAVQSRMARDFGGDSEKIRRQSMQDVTLALGLSMSDWKPSELVALSELALVLALISDLSRWSKVEKIQIARIIRAKASADESNYLRLLQKHKPLRSEIISLGSS